MGHWKRAIPIGIGAAILWPVAAMAQATAPEINGADTVWVLVSTALVLFMTLPGLALFYGGLVRAKNMLSVLTQVFAGFAIIALLWVIYGYTLAFVGAGSAADATALTPYIGNLSKIVIAVIAALLLLGLGGRSQCVDHWVNNRFDC